MIRSTMPWLLLGTTMLLAACSRQDGDRATVAPPETGNPASVVAQTTAGPGVFSNIALPPIDNRPMARCSIDKIGTANARGQTVTVQSGADVHFGGWIADSQRKVPNGFTVVLSGGSTYGVTGKAGVRRRDVARSLASPALATSGFDVTAALGEVAPGEYSIGILIADQGKNVLCKTSSRLSVAAATSG